MGLAEYNLCLLVFDLVRLLNHGRLEKPLGVILAEDLGTDRGPSVLGHRLCLGKVRLLHLDDLIFGLAL